MKAGLTLCPAHPPSHTPTGTLAGTTPSSSFHPLLTPLRHLTYNPASVLEHYFSRSYLYACRLAEEGVVIPPGTR